MVSFLIFGKNNQVIATLVGFPFFLIQRTAGYIHLTTYDGLE